jgi:hypothetical protein
MSRKNETSHNPNSFKLLSVIAAILSIGLIFYHWLKLGTPITGIDDFRIYLVYFRNIAEGFGPAYNKGGEYVEGYSSPLYTLIGAAVYKLLGEGTSTFFLFFNTAIHIGLSIYSFHWLRSWSWDRFWALIAATGILIAHTSIYWNMFSLLETSLWTATFTIIFYKLFDLAKGKSTSSLVPMILVAISPYIRPEAYLFVPVLLLSAYFYTETATTRKMLIRLIILFVASLLVLLTARYEIFGYILPNTYYAKQIDPIRKIGEGIYYIARTLYHTPILILPPILALLSKKIIGLNKKEYLFSIFLILAFLLMPFLGGVDHFIGGRFYVPLSPLLSLFIIFYAKIYFDNKRYDLGVKKQLAVLVIIIFAFPALNYIALIRVKILDRNEFMIVEKLSSNAKQVELTFPDQPSAGIIAAGEFGYQYGGAVLDLVGLNHVSMAHSTYPRTDAPLGHVAFSPDVLLSVKPDILLPSQTSLSFSDNIIGSRIWATFESSVMKYCDTLPEFKHVYTPLSIFRKNDTFGIISYLSREYLNKLDTSKYLIINH